MALAALLAACARSAAPVTVAHPAGVPRAEPAAPWVPDVSVVAIELSEDAPMSLRDARFELPDGPGAWTEIAPVVDGEQDPAPAPQHGAASFLIDFDQDPLRSMCGGTSLPIDAVLSAVDERLARKSLAVGMVTASAAAGLREGDCTEHAMLAAALLRCHGHPARIALGLLVARVGDRWMAGGHMWAEHYDRGWHVADATRPERHGEAAYLRIAVVDDEGPGAMRAMVQPFLRAASRRVRVSARQR